MSQFVPTTWSDTLEHIRKIAEALAIIESKGDASNYNYYINGDLTCWQRGTTFASDVGLRFLADRWGVNSSISRVYAEQLTLEQNEFIRSSPYALRLAVSSGNESGAFANVFQRVENVRAFAGIPVCFSLWARADASRDLAFEFVQNFGYGGSGEVTGIGKCKVTVGEDWQQIYASVILPELEDDVTLGEGHYTALILWLDGSIERASSIGFQDGVYDLTQAKLEVGDEPTDFISISEGEVIALCQRYYETGVSIYSGDVTSGASYQTEIPFATKKRAPPSIGIVEYNCLGFAAGGYTVADSSVSQARVYKIANADQPGGFYHFAWAADAEL